MFARLSSPTLFPTYLLPSIPFRRRKFSTDSSSSSNSTSSTNGSPTEPSYLSGHTSRLRCTTCSTDICLTSQIISKGFTGRHGRAYLVSPNLQSAHPDGLPNTKTDAPSSRQLVTGVHTVADVRCVMCGSLLGWKYVGADEESQRYKVGKYILETKCVGATSNWEIGKMSPLHLDEDASEIEFDSQDEDECEDLFAGVWSKELAVKRRQGKKFRKVESGVDERRR